MDLDKTMDLNKTADQASDLAYANFKINPGRHCETNHKCCYLSHLHLLSKKHPSPKTGQHSRQAVNKNVRKTMSDMNLELKSLVKLKGVSWESASLHAIKT